MPQLAQSRPDTEHRRPPRRTAVVVGIAGVLVLLGIAIAVTDRGGAQAGSGAGVQVAGELSSWLLTVSRICFDVALSASVGCLLVLAWVYRLDPTSPVVVRLRRAARAWSLGWAVAAALWWLATASQVLGVPLDEVLTSTRGLELLRQLPQGRALVLSMVAALTVALLVSRVATWIAAVLLLVLGMLATGPLLLTGHAASSSSHYLAGQTLLVHVFAVVLWVGGLLVLGTHLGDQPVLVAALSRRFSALALVCFVLVAASGVAGMWTRLGFDLDLWRSSYGALAAAKAVALVVLGVCGVAHRRYTLHLLDLGRPRGFVRLAAGELVVMGTAVALGVVLARTPPPAGALSRAVPQHASVASTIDGSLGPLNLRSLLTETRPDALVLTVLVTVAALSVWRFVADGDLRRRWSLSGLAAWEGGLLVVAWAVCGGLGTYAPAVLSAQVGQLLTLAFAAAPLLVVGAPRGLLQGSGLPAAVRRVGGMSQTNGLVALTALVVAAFSTPLLAMTARNPVAHLALAAAALGCGLAFIGPQRSKSGGSDPVLMWGLLAVVLLLEGARLWRSSSLLAGDWFGTLDWWWSDPHRDQQAAAVVCGAFAVAAVGASALQLWRERGAQG